MERWQCTQSGGKVHQTAVSEPVTSQHEGAEGALARQSLEQGGGVSRTETTAGEVKGGGGRIRFEELQNLGVGG